MNEQIFLGFKMIMKPDIRTVHIFLPMLNKREIDTWPIIRWLWENKRTVVVPEMEEFSHQLISRLLHPDTKVQSNTWGVPQPVNATMMDDRTIDLVILPLLVYDVRGYRVGYGSGYYDGFLSSLTTSPLKIGLSYFPPVDEIADIYSGDVKMDACVTPSGVITF